MNIKLSPEFSKHRVFQEIESFLGRLSLGVVSIDTQRPWGGFFVMDESEADNFIDAFFPDLDGSQTGQGNQRLSPKVLVVEPGKRLSWQYHNRRAELWRVVSGPAGVITSEDDVQGAVDIIEPNETIQFDKKVRHRLIGLRNWGVVAEIWQHTDPNNPSDESDIHRVEDDFGR